MREKKNHLKQAQHKQKKNEKKNKKLNNLERLNCFRLLIIFFCYLLFVKYSFNSMQPCMDLLLPIFYSLSLTLFLSVFIETIENIRVRLANRTQLDAAHFQALLYFLAAHFVKEGTRLMTYSIKMKKKYCHFSTYLECIAHTT